MMPCPKCQTKVPGKNTKRAKGHVTRNYYCRCGQSFTTRERITRKWKRVNPMRVLKPSGVAALVRSILTAEKTS